MKLATLAVCLCVLAVSAAGQTALATITGTVADASGASVANAPIEVHNLGTGQIIAAASSATGNYTVSQLPVGDYDLTVSVPGFKSYNRKGFHLAAAQTLREDIVLEIGSATESVTVTADATLLKTESSELVHNVTVSQMNNLPILAVGTTGAGFRDPFALVRMIPGTSYAAGATMVINGNPNLTVQYRLEGQTMGNTSDRYKSYTQQTQASTDAVEEVAVQTSNYAAEFGTAGGGVINMVMKSGTNQYHGSGYDYMVNEVLNAATPYTGLRNKVRRNDYGFTFGGPVKIPKIYDGTNKTFFFFSWEQYLENLTVTTTSPTVPIPAYRNGDFSPLIASENNRALQVGGVNYTNPLGRPQLSGMIFDPLTTQALPNGGTVRDQFPNNQIPASRFDPVALNVLQLVPLPLGINSDRGQIGSNYQSPWPSDRNSRIPSIKIDQNIGQKGRLSGYWQDTSTATQYGTGPNATEGFPLPITQTRGSFIIGKTMRVNYDHTISPTILLHLGAGWNSLNFDDRAPVLNYDAYAELGLRGATVNRTFPVINMGSSAAQLTANGGMSQLGAAIQGPGFERRPSGNVTLSWVRQNHTFKFGAEYRLEKYPFYDFSNVAGNYNFSVAGLGGGPVSYSTSQSSLATSPAPSQGINGFAFASFLLGDIGAATLTQPSQISLQKSQWGIYLQDNWKVTSKLTLDYGVRWDYGTYAREQHGRNGNFNFNIPNPSAGGHPGGQIFESTCNCNFASNYPYAIGPRVGFAYQLNSKTVLRGGFGVVYNATGAAGGTVVSSANAGNPGFGQSVGKFADGIPSTVQPIWPNFAANAGQPNGAVVAAPVFLDPNAGRPARQMQWSLGIQREFNRNLVVEGSYVANRGSWWSAGGLTANNVLQISDLTRFGFNDLTSSAESRLLTTQIRNLTAGDRATLASRGITLPYSGYDAFQTVRQSILPFPQYTGAITPAQAPLGKTWYDAFQLNITQRFSHGLSLNANYTFSKNLDLMSAPDIFNRETGKNISGNDIPHQFRMTAEYQVPSLRNSGIKYLSNPTVSYILGGWGVGWYLQYQSAPVLDRPTNQGGVPLNNFLNRGPGPAQLKIGPDGKPMNPWSVNWTDYDGVHHTDPIDINCHCFDPTKTIVLNPNAWENVPNGKWSNSFSDLRYYRGIRYPTENLNVSRNFRIKEGILIHVRVEFQNVLNRTRLPQPSATANFTATPQKFPTGANTGLYSSGFGTIVPVTGTTGPRTGTFIARITF